MSTTDTSLLPENSSGSHPMAVRQPTFIEPQDAGWAAPEIIAPPQSSSASVVAYLHALRRHWAMATGLGLALALTGALIVWFWMGESYTALAHVILDESPRPVMGEARHAGPAAFEIYKQTQKQLTTNPNLIEAALRKPGIGKLACVRAEDYPRDWLANAIHAYFPGDAEIMVISLSGDNKKEVTTLVNAVFESYLDEVRNNERNARTNRLRELENIHRETERNVREKRNRLQTLAGLLRTADPEALALKQRIAVQEWAELQRQFSQVRFLLNTVNGELQTQDDLIIQIGEREISQPEINVELRRDPIGRRLAEELAYRMMDAGYNQELVRRGSRGGYVTQASRDLQSIQNQLDQRGKELAEEIRALKIAEFKEERTRCVSQKAVLEKQQKLLADDVAEKKQEAQELSESTIEFMMMRDDIDSLKQVLATIAEERERIKVELDAPTRIQRWQEALEPLSPDNLGTRVTLTVFMAMLGLCLPVGIIAWWDTRKRRVNSADDVSKGLGISVIGKVPLIPARVHRQLGSPTRRNQNWRMRLTESIDTIVARLLRKAELDQARVVLVSSAVGGEGKTTLATQLALSLARNGRSTVLVDFDLRQPAFDEVFGLPLEPGVSEILRQQDDVGDAVQATGTDNLSVLTAGSWDRIALAALANGGAGPIFERLREEHEFVIIDAAPILPVADTRFVSQHVDSVILSVFRDVSQAPKVEAACEILEAFGVSVVEAVVTGHAESLREKDLSYQSQQPV